MSRTQTAQVQYGAPHITNDDLFAFHEAHFSQDATVLFGDTFVNSLNDQQTHDDQDYEQQEEEDDLGYYEDGVKRTLTDEQIEIFRHSELEALRRDREKQSNNRIPASSDESKDLDDVRSAQLQDLTEESKVRGNKKNKKKKKAPQREPKPDLRKRTWDVVEKGLDSLEYD